MDFDKKLILRLKISSFIIIIVMKYKVIDIYTNKILDVFYPINTFDVDLIIIEKIFISSEINNENIIHPDIIYIEKNNNVINVYNLIYFIYDYILKNIEFFINDNYQNTKEFKTLYSSLVNTKYPNLKREILYLIIEYIINKFFLNKSLSINIKNWINSINDYKNKLKHHYNLLYQEKISKQINDFIFTKNKIYKYSILSSILNYKFDVKINTAKIIQEYPLSTNIPFMISENIDTSEPNIKFLKSLSNNIVSDWIYNNKKLKNIKSLMFKLKGFDNNYYTGFIQNNNLNIRASWNNDENTTFEEINNINDKIKQFLNNTSKILYEPRINNFKYTISYLYIIFFTKKLITLPQISLTLNNFKDLFTLSIYNDNYIKFRLNKKINNSTINIIIKYSFVSLDDKSNKLLKTNSISISGITNENQILSVIDFVLRFLIIAYEKKALIFKDFQLIEEKPLSVVKTLRKKELIRDIRNIGINIDTVSCQKQRQPIFYKKGINTVPKNSYILNYKDNSFICDKNDYPYPGFTNKNIICCFKKDQRSKSIYKKNINTNDTSSETNTIMTDKVILKQPIILKYKLLDNYRLGVIPDKVKNILINKNSSTEIYRLGSLYGNSNLLDCLNKSTNKNITNDDLLTFIHKNKVQSFFNQNINSENDLINYIKNKKLIYGEIGRFLESFFKLNIIVFNINDTDDDRIICKEPVYLHHDNSAILFERDVNNNTKHYELLVLKKSNKNLQKIFDNNNKIINNVMSIYRQSCIINYTGYPNVPMTYADLLKQINNLKITSQVINNFNKISYIFTNFGLLPVIPTKPIPNLKNNNLNTLTYDANKQSLLLNKCNIEYLKPIGQIIDKNSNTIGIVTKSALIVPTNPSKLLNKLPVIYRQFITNIDDLLFNNVPSLDNKFSYILEITYYNELYNRLKYILSKIIQNSDINEQNVYNFDRNTLKNKLKNLLNDQVLFTSNVKPIEINNTRNVCSELSLKSCSYDPFCKIKNDKCLMIIERKIYNNFISRLVTEMSWNKKIISGKINKEFDRKDKFIKRNNEILLLNEDSILNFLNK